MKLKKDLMDRIGISTSWRTLDVPPTMLKHICVAWLQESGRSSTGSVSVGGPSPPASRGSTWMLRGWSVSCTCTTRKRGSLSLKTIRGCCYFEAIFHENPCFMICLSLLVDTSIQMMLCKYIKYPEIKKKLMSKMISREGLIDSCDVQNEKWIGIGPMPRNVCKASITFESWRIVSWIYKLELLCKEIVQITSLRLCS